MVYKKHNFTKISVLLLRIKYQLKSNKIDCIHNTMIYRIDMILVYIHMQLKYINLMKYSSK